MPTAFTAITVSGTFQDTTSSGEVPSVGSVSFMASGPMEDTVNHVVREPARVSVALDGSGHFSVTLPATDDTGVTPTGVVYNVEILIQGQPPRRFSIPLPHATPSVDISSYS